VNARTVFKAGLVPLVLLAIIVTAYLSYYAALNAYGPSTQLYDLWIGGSAKWQRGNTYLAYLGDKVQVEYTVKRHKLNGDCHLPIWRGLEEIGGPHDGKWHLMDYVEIRFVGRDQEYKARWPVGRELVLDYGVKTKPSDRSGDPLPVPDLDAGGKLQRGEPIMADGVDEQLYAVYNVGRYRCNILDDWFPRFLQGGVRPNQSQRALLIIRRDRP
jgi:hypothetical protein